MIFNSMEEEIVLRMGSAQFGLPGKEEDRNGPNAKPRTLGIGWILYGLVRAARPKTILEIGTGGSTACLLWGLKHNGIGHIHTCDVFASGETDDKHFLEYLKEKNGEPMNHNKADVVRMIRKWEMENICTIYHESSMDLLPKWNIPVDMVVVDGDHRKKFLENDVKFMNFLKPGGYGMFHDFLACLWEVGGTLRDWVEQGNEWALIVEPNCLSMGIVQRKFSLNCKNALVAWYLTQECNPNGAKTPIQATDPKACGMIEKWDGEWFPRDGKEYHSQQPEAEIIANKIIEFEKNTGTIVQSMEEWNNG